MIKILETFKNYVKIIFLETESHSNEESVESSIIIILLIIIFSSEQEWQRQQSSNGLQFINF